MSTYSPDQLVDLVRNLSPDEAHTFWARAGSAGALTTEHARELLCAARTISEWHKIVAILNIGDILFDNEFVDYAIDMLTFPASGEDPFAVVMHANNLLISRKTIRRDQYRRIAQLPESTPGKQKLLESLKVRVA